MEHVLCVGLQRCGKSCRLRWTNYLRPDLKHGQFSQAEEETIMKLHAVVGNRWSLIAAQLPGRTDNDVKNHWNTKLKKKLTGMGIDPVTHKSFSHLMAEIATTLGPPQVANLTEAALGCFKDEMLHLLTKKRIDTHSFQLQPTTNNHMMMMSTSKQLQLQDQDTNTNTVDKIKLGLSRAIQLQDDTDSIMISNKQPPCWDPHPPSNTEATPPSSNPFSGVGFGQHYGQSSSFVGSQEDGSPWNQSMCSGSTSTPGDQLGNLKLEDDHDSQTAAKHISSTIFTTTDCVLWDLPSDELMNPIL